ncbi:TlpA family protein disulfide reductase [Flagellimonas sp. HMM57]|uniref:TlpA family protein disulfide reductase n=1 Tax=unclassified Flagellimonas TaxID=2644544 RepID=UPI0013D7F84C|nr:MULTISPECIES: TlpA disulfide reductase family protein [unclassified Flagellimonas]UII76538.1 TlpA family protein disulfide reductase [Flagellimonas sp. HMM57]
MKLSKNQVSNIVWILVIALMLFTPVGFHLRVFVGKIFAGSPDIVSNEEQQKLVDYDWNLIGLNGDTLNFEEKKGEVVLLNFWATWCPPCIAELPSLVKLHTDYHDKVVFAFIASDDRDKVVSLLNKKEYELPVFFEKTNTPSLLSHKSIPTTYIIDKSGKIVVAENGVANWNSENVRNLLDKLLLE